MAILSADVLSDRALGRATLARQLLLQRAPLSPMEAVAHLASLERCWPSDRSRA